MGIPGRRPSATGAGFTLVELVLTVALLLLFVGAAVFNFGSAQRGSQLEEGAGQLESLFRYARAQAASTGRLVRVNFGGGAEVAAGATNAASVPEGIQVVWEPDPLGAPGTFQLLREATAFTERLNEMVQFRPVLTVDIGLDGLAITNAADSLHSSSGGEPKAASAAMDEMVLTHPQPITFYPDGSSDSREMILVSVDQEDRRQLQLTLAGLTGTVRRKWLAAEGEPTEPTFSEPTMSSGGSSPSVAPTK